MFWRKKTKPTRCQPTEAEKEAAKQRKHRLACHRKANQAVQYYTVGAMGMGLVPVPLVDLAAISGIQLQLLRQLAQIYGVPFSADLGKALLTSLTGGALSVSGSSAVSSLLKLIPGVGTWSGAVSTSLLAGASTYAVGQVFIQHFASGGTFLNFDVKQVRAYYQRELETGKQVVKHLKNINNLSKTVDTPVMTPGEDVKKPPKTVATAMLVEPTVMNIGIQDEDGQSIHTTEQKETMSETKSPVEPQCSENIQQPVAKKKMLWIVVLILLILSAAGAGSWFYVQENNKSPVYIAVCGPMTGPYAENGKTMVDVAELRAAQMNREGGIQGHPVKVLSFDDQNNTEKALEVARKIATETEVVAVIGHYTSSTSLAASPVYREYGLAALTGSATADRLTKENGSYFRLIFNNSDQAGVAANYASKVLKRESASLVSVNNAFGGTLAKAFVKEAGNIGLEIKRHWRFNPDDEAGFEKIRAEMTEYYRNSDNPELLFIGTHSGEAVQLLTSLRVTGKHIPVIGADSLSSSGFRNQIKQYPQERVRPGYYTNGIYAISPFLPDIAGERAQQFAYEFAERYQEEPTITASMYYDVVTVTLAALRNVDPQLNIKDRRKALLDGLWHYSSPKTALEGVTGSIYFDQNGDVVKAIPIGFFKRGKPWAASEQFMPIDDLSNITTLLEDALKDQVIYVNGKFMRRAQVVYTGMDFNSITELDSRTSTFLVDFYLWFRFKHDIPDKHIEFLNLAKSELVAESTLLEPIREEISKVEEGAITRAYRIKTSFKGDFNFADYPLDTQILPIRFLHKTLTRNQLIYVVDRLGMETEGTEGMQGIMNKLKRNHLFQVNGWHPTKLIFYQNTRKTDSTLGIPELFDARKRIEYSVFNVALEIGRNIRSFVLKNLMPIFVVTLLGYFIFFIPLAGPGFAVRMALGGNMIMTTSLFHLRLASNMPDIDYLLLIEYLFYTVYVLGVFTILITVVAQWEITDNTSKQSILHAKRVDSLGQIFYPLIIILALSGITYLYITR